MYTGISVACGVAQGTFMSEYFTKIKRVDGSWWEGAVDKEMVFELEGEPAEKNYVEGRVYAYLISYNSESALVELPIEDSPIGRRISVPLELVRKERVPA